MDSHNWVAVRCVFRTVVDNDRVYEERITIWRAEDIDAALDLAEADARDYAQTLSVSPGWPTEYTGLAQAYLMTEGPKHGGEVFSLMRTSTLDSREYLDRFFDDGNERQRSGTDPD
jgi:hypothetical protein